VWQDGDSCDKGRLSGRKTDSVSREVDEATKTKRVRFYDGGRDPFPCHEDVIRYDRPRSNAGSQYRLRFTVITPPRKNDRRVDLGAMARAWWRTGPTAFPMRRREHRRSANEGKCRFARDESVSFQVVGSANGRPREVGHMAQDSCSSRT